MPVKLTPSDNILFLANYTPPNAANISLVENIRDMISVDLQSLTTPYTIDYPIGAYDNDQLAFRVTFRNLTTNATLTVSQEQTRDLLLLLNDNNVLTNRTITLTLAPGETRGLNILFNNNLLNSSVRTNLLENLRLVVSYEKNGDVIARNNLDVLSPITI